MTGEQRREEILLRLNAELKAVPARVLAEHYGVSRQVIVGDIALLRAQGANIIATHRGYIIKREADDKILKTIAVNHNKDQTREELELLVNLGAQVVDVTVEHPIYGQITGQLNIQSQDDIDDFLEENPELLSSLTEGTHIHGIYCNDEEHYKEITKQLKNRGFLYED
ncbi:MAG TPA: transcription repressor NadR [Erysipelothrix sp.]